jgi:large subunit ribosomal protein L10
MRAEKKSIVDEVRSNIQESEYVFLADYMGLTVSQISDLRGQLRKSEARLQVAKNTYVAKALAPEVAEALTAGLSGPTAVVFGCGDATEAAKILKAFAKQNELPKVKGGCLNNKALTAQDVQAMADLPSRDVLLGMVVGTLAAPMSGLVGVCAATLRSVMYALKAVEEKKQEAA